jgi:hypothetical protein
MAQGMSQQKKPIKKPARHSQSGFIETNALAVFITRPQAALSNRRRSNPTTTQSKSQNL